MVLQRLCQGLVQTGHDIVELELKWTEEVMKFEIIYLFVIVNVVNFYFKALRLFKVVVNTDFCNEVRI